MVAVAALEPVGGGAASSPAHLTVAAIVSMQVPWAAEQYRWSEERNGAGPEQYRAEQDAWHGRRSIFLEV